MSSRRTQLLVLSGMAALIVVAAIVVNQAGTEDSGGSGDLDADAREVERLLAGIPQDGVLLGDPQAPLRVTEWVDLQCPFCADFAREALPGVIDRHVRRGEVALELRVISLLGEDSREGAEVAAAAALQKRLWQFADLFFHQQGAEGSGYVTEDFLGEIAAATPGLDDELALERRSSPEAMALLAENDALASRLGVDSTPSFFLDLGGSVPQRLELRELTAAGFSEALDSALARD